MSVRSFVTRLVSLSARQFILQEPKFVAYNTLLSLVGFICYTIACFSELAIHTNIK